MFKAFKDLPPTCLLPSSLNTLTEKKNMSSTSPVETTEDAPEVNRNVVQVEVSFRSYDIMCYFPDE